MTENLPFQPCLRLQFCGPESIHSVQQPTTTIVRVSSSAETLHPWNMNSLFLPLLFPGNHDSPVCVYEFDYSRYHIYVASYHICSFITSLFHSAYVFKLHACRSLSEFTSLWKPNSSDYMLIMYLVYLFIPP